ncbi:unnamed protein product [Dibothriocephalus latus]|uniref:Uncharacterized protein n=1 Tax=Dibothriocephalus latus TaxID=60516 RepID=A0A3P7NSP6_DIBLA|nr:unnamed protein product [Dibothriocephalus latus]
MPRTRRFDVAKLRQTNTTDTISTEIRSRHTNQTDNEGSNKWPSLNTSIYGAAEKVLGFTQRRRNDWISGRTLQLSAETTRASSRNDAFFRRLRKLTAK